MKYFTEQYIKECDCEIIQKQKEQLDYCCKVALKIDNERYEEKIYRAFSKGINNKYLLSSGWADVASGIYKRSRIVWLPIGDDLDLEIVKICDKKEWDYRIDYAKKDFIAYVKNLWWNFRSNNPLIAKIKLLKQLIKED